MRAVWCLASHHVLCCDASTILLPPKPNSTYSSLYSRISPRRMISSYPDGDRRRPPVIAELSTLAPAHSRARSKCGACPGGRCQQQVKPLSTSRGVARGAELHLM